MNQNIISIWKCKSPYFGETFGIKTIGHVFMVFHNSSPYSEK